MMLPTAMRPEFVLYRVLVCTGLGLQLEDVRGGWAYRAPVVGWGGDENGEGVVEREGAEADVNAFGWNGQRLWHEILTD